MDKFGGNRDSSAMNADIVSMKKRKDDKMLRMIIPGEKESRFEDDSENLK